MREAALRFIRRDAWKDGRAFFEDAARKTPENAEAHAHLGFFLVKESRYDTTRGLAELDRALRLDPGCALACVYKAIVLACLRDGAAAARAVEGARRLAAAPQDLLWAQAYIELNTGDVKKAIGHFRALAETSGDATSLILLSQAISQSGDDMEALKVARKAAEKDPDDFRAPLYAGIYLVQLGRCEEARRELAHAAKLNGASPLLHHTLAYAALREVRIAEAEGHLREALRLDPDYVTSRKMLADLCAASGRTAEARSHYERALTLFPDFPEAHEALRRLPGR